MARVASGQPMSAATAAGGAQQAAAVGLGDDRVAGRAAGGGDPAQRGEQLGAQVRGERGGPCHPGRAGCPGLARGSRNASSSSSRAVRLAGPVALVGSGPVIPAEREASQAAASARVGEVDDLLGHRAGGDDDRGLARARVVGAGVVGAVDALPRMAASPPRPRCGSALRRSRSGWVCGRAAYRLCHAGAAACSSPSTQARDSITAPSAVVAVAVQQVRGMPVVGAGERALSRRRRGPARGTGGRAGRRRCSGSPRRSAASRSRACSGCASDWDASHVPAGSGGTPVDAGVVHGRAPFRPCPACVPGRPDSRAARPPVETAAWPEGEHPRVS